MTWFSWIRFRAVACVMMITLSVSGCAGWTPLHKTLAITSTLATAADAYTTTRFLDNPNNYEMNPVLGKHPSNAEVVSYLAFTQLVTLGIAHLWPEARPWILGGKTLINGSLALHNTTLDWSKD